jgi:hypothetical protein
MTTIIRVDKLSAGEYSGQRAHDLRLETATHSIPPYVERSKTQQNSVLVEHIPLPDLHARNEELKQKAKDAAHQNYLAALSSSSPKAIEEARKQKQACRQKYSPSGVVGYSGLIGFGVEAQRVFSRLAPEEQDSYFKASAEALAAEMDVELVGLVVHRDESSIHAQFVTSAVTHRGTKVRLQPEDCSMLQDIGCKPFSRLGFKRGIKKEEREKSGDEKNKTVNRSVKQLHEDLPREIKQAEQALLAAQEAAITAQELLAAKMQEVDRLRKVLAQAKWVAEQSRPPVQTFEVVTGPGPFGIGKRTEPARLYTPEELAAYGRTVAFKAAREIIAKEKSVEARESALQREIDAFKADLMAALKKREQSLSLRETKLQIAVDLRSGALDAFARLALADHPDLVGADATSLVASWVEQGHYLAEIRSAVAGSAVEAIVGRACDQVQERLDAEQEQEAKQAQWDMRG